MFFKEMKPVRNTQFIVKQKTDIDSVFELLCQRYSVHETFYMQLKRHYLDSFDWRMHQKNYACGWDVPDSKYNNSGKNNKDSKNISNREGVFFIHDKASGSSIYELPFSHMPKFPKDITHRTCRKLLDDILGIRALMTVAMITMQRRQLLVLNKENKTLAILQAESYAINGQAGETHLPGRLIVFPVRGYKKVFKQVLRYISEHLKLPCASHTPLDEALTVIGRLPALNAFALTPKLADSLNTWEAAQILLRHLLTVMQANEPGLRDAIDTEFLHDYRIAIRRTRSMLSQIKHIFPSTQLDYFKREFCWLGAMTTPTRDLDMYLLKFDDYLHELPVDLRYDLTLFRTFLERHWKVEHARLCRALDSRRYQKLISQWQQTLETQHIESQEALPQKAFPAETFNATKPAKLVASKRIWRIYKRILYEGRAITPQSHDEDLHELRKTCKKFRYLIEFFHDYYPDRHIKNLVKILKQLQENLGEFQDLCVQIAQLNYFAEQMQREGLVDTKTIMAMGVLVEKLNARKVAARAEFSQCFKAFAQPDRKAAFNRAFHSGINQKV